MKKWLLSFAAIAFSIVPATAATDVSVEAIGSVLNESLALPANDTPGSGISFDEFFEFSLPVTETVTLSMSDSGIGSERITGGVLSLNLQTSTGPGPLFIPLGSLIESDAVTNVLGGQEATVNPDVLGAGNYFAEISGVSGTSPIHLAVDGTVTATQAVPEASTWAMILTGFALLGWAAWRKPKGLTSQISLGG